MRHLLTAVLGVLIGLGLAFGGTSLAAGLRALGPSGASGLCARAARIDPSELGLGQGRPEAPGGATATVVPLEEARGVWIVPVLLNGARAARFLLDTGSSVTLLAPRVAAKLPGGLPARDPVELQTLTGVTTGPSGRLASLRIGDVDLHDVPVVLHEPGPGLDGILGNTVLARYRLTLDADRGLLHLAAAR